MQIYYYRLCRISNYFENLRTVSVNDLGIKFLVIPSIYVMSENFKLPVYNQVEYSSSIWDPHTQKDIKLVEMVQHRGARFVTNTPHKRQAGPQPSVTNIINDLGWKSLQDRRKNNRLVLLYKIQIIWSRSQLHTTLPYVPPSQDEETSTSTSALQQRSRLLNFRSCHAQLLTGTASVPQSSQRIPWNPSSDIWSKAPPDTCT